MRDDGFFLFFRCLFILEGSTHFLARYELSFLKFSSARGACRGDAFSVFERWRSRLYAGKHRESTGAKDYGSEGSGLGLGDSSPVGAADHPLPLLSPAGGLARRRGKGCRGYLWGDWANLERSMWIVRERVANTHAVLSARHRTRHPLRVFWRCRLSEAGCAFTWYFLLLVSPLSRFVGVGQARTLLFSYRSD